MCLNKEEKRTEGGEKESIAPEEGRTRRGQGPIFGGDSIRA